MPLVIDVMVIALEPASEVYTGLAVLLSVVLNCTVWTLDDGVPGAVNILSMVETVPVPELGTPLVTPTEVRFAII